MIRIFKLIKQFGLMLIIEVEDRLENLVTVYSSRRYQISKDSVLTTTVPKQFQSALPLKTRSKNA